MSQFSSVQSPSRVPLFATPWTAACQASLSITSSRSLLKLLSIKSVMPSNYLILCPLLLPSIFSSIRVFSNESVLCISPSNEYSGLISFRIDWFDLLAVQGLSRVFSNITVQKISFLALSFLYDPALTSIHEYWKNHQFSSVAQSCPTLCHPMDCTSPGFPVHHQLCGKPLL